MSEVNAAYDLIKSGQANLAYGNAHGTASPYQHGHSGQTRTLPIVMPVVMVGPARPILLKGLIRLSLFLGLSMASDKHIVLRTRRIRSISAIIRRLSIFLIISWIVALNGISTVPLPTTVWVTGMWPGNMPAWPLKWNRIIANIKICSIK